MPVISAAQHKRIFEAIEEVADVGGWLFDVERQTVFWSRRTRLIHEMPAGSTPTLVESINYYLPEYRELVDSKLSHAIATGGVFAFKAKIQTHKDNVRWVSAYGKAEVNPINQKVDYVYGSFQDITESMDELQRVQEQQNVLETILDNILEGLIVINQKGLIQSFNKAAEDIFGYTEESVIGENIKMLMPEPNRGRHDSYLQNYHKTKQAKIIGIGRDVEGQHSDGSLFPVALSIAEVEINNQKHFLGTVRDLSKEQESANRIEWLSHYDEATGLPNRNFLLNYLNNTEFEHCLVIVTLNIDFFSRIYLAYGMKESEVVIQELSERLTKYCATEDFICRDLADRFWIVLSGECWCNKSKLESFIESLLKLISEPLNIHGHQHFLSASVGVAQSQHAQSPVALLSKAELALHESRKRGRGLYTINDGASSNEEIIQNYRLEQELRRAIDSNQIECWIQPKMDCALNLCSAEVLVRWRKDDGTLVFPDQFIPLAESSGLMAALGDVIIEQTASMLTTLHQLDSDMSLAMNVSPAQFLKDSFATKLVDTFAKHDAPLSNLIIEITENLLISDSMDVNDKVEALTRQGVTFSIDDFGTGYSNLKRIQDISLSELKIDKSFTWQCEDGGSGVELVRAMIALAKSMKLHVVAEGVETAEQVRILLAMGVDFLQGYYFDKPLEFELFLEKYFSQSRAQ